MLSECQMKNSFDWNMFKKLLVFLKKLNQISMETCALSTSKASLNTSGLQVGLWFWLRIPDVRIYIPSIPSFPNRTSLLCPAEWAGFQCPPEWGQLPALHHHTLHVQPRESMFVCNRPPCTEPEFESWLCQDLAVRLIDTQHVKTGKIEEIE